jgi:very-short-patch-repair endonuclease
MHPSLAARAAASGGTFTRQDAIAAGYTPAEIRSRLDSGSWLRLRRGRYVDAGLFSSEDALASYRLHCWAAWTSLDGARAVSHRSAALLDALDLHPAAARRAAELVELILPEGHSRRRPGVLGHDLPLADDEVVERHGLPVTTSARTAIDVASVETSVNGIITMDSLLRRWAGSGIGRSDAQLRLAATADRWPRRHHRRIHRAIAFADGLSETAGESLSRVLLAAQGLPAALLQFVVGDFRADFAWPEYRTLGEFDGRLKYTDPQVLWAEKLREDALRDAGWELVRWTWAQITSDAPLVAARLRTAFRRGARRAG